MIGWVEQPPIGLSWRSHDNDRVVHAAIIHVAVADVDATYGADVAAENNTFDINNTNKNANIKPVVSNVRGVYAVPFVRAPTK